MPEAVIVATARSPIGRAGKGSLKGMRPDTLATRWSRQSWTGPALDRNEIDDLHARLRPAGRGSRFQPRPGRSRYWRVWTTLAGPR